jgi:tetratricopeptide (TPR) repeat protein
MWTSPTLTYVGRAEEAVRNAERAIQLSPEDPLMFRYQHFLSIAQYGRGDFEQAADWGLRSMRGNGSYVSNLVFTIAALGALGRTREAKPLVNRCTQLLPEYRASTNKTPFSNRTVWELFVSHLVAAGMPA